MRNVPKAVGASLLLLALGAAENRAHAQPPLDPGREAAEAGEPASVQASIQRGIELRRQGKDVEALQVFREAFEQAPTSNRVRIHLAVTHQALGQWVEASRHLSDALAQPDDPYVKRHRVPLERALSYVDDRIGSVEVLGQPAGADVLLSGRYLGKVPLSEPVRVPAGAYLLEVRMDGHYPISRPLTVGGRTFLRERVDLIALASPPSAELPVRAPATPADGGTGQSHWLGWTLAGLGGASAATAAVAWAIREDHAARWNSDACLDQQRTRGQVCGSELDSGRIAERVAIGAGIGAGVLFGGALVTLLFEDQHAESAGLQVSGCGLGGTLLSCFGSF